MVKDYGQVPYFNDDFAYFQQKKQSVLLLTGRLKFKKKELSQMNPYARF